MARQKQDMNLLKLTEEFASEDACRTYLEALRWPAGIKCPRCGWGKATRVVKRHQYDCEACRYQFSVTAGTIFHDSHLPLRTWLIAVYLITESKKGISASQMQRTLSVSYRTAWYLCHRIRAALADEQPEPLRGIVEVDETYVGGKKRGMGRGYVGNKTMVLGAIQRGGNVRLTVEKRADKATLHRFVRSATHPDTEAIHTDEWPAYNGVADGNTRHETVNHREEEWVRADVHTNTVEGVWSLFKRSIVGSYHQVSAKHMDAYLQEFSVQVQLNRHNPSLFRESLLKLVQASALPYQQLVHQDSV